MASNDVLRVRQVLDANEQGQRVVQPVTAGDVEGEQLVRLLESAARCADTDRTDEVRRQIRTPAIAVHTDGRVQLVLRDVGDRITRADVAEEVGVRDVGVEPAVDIGVDDLERNGKAGVSRQLRGGLEFEPPARWQHRR